MQEIEHNLSLEYVTRVEAVFQWNAFPSKFLLAKVRKYTGLVVRGCVLNSSYDPNTAVRLGWRLGKCTLKVDALPRTKPVCHGHCRYQLRCATVIAGYQLRFKQAVQ